MRVVEKNLNSSSYHNLFPFFGNMGNLIIKLTNILPK